MTGCLVGATEKEFRARVARLEAQASTYPLLADYRERLATRGVVSRLPTVSADSLSRGWSG
jgi:hypothetical protein